MQTVSNRKMIRSMGADELQDEYSRLNKNDYPVSEWLERMEALDEVKQQYKQLTGNDIQRQQISAL